MYNILLHNFSIKLIHNDGFVTLSTELCARRHNKIPKKHTPFSIVFIYFWGYTNFMAFHDSKKIKMSIKLIWWLKLPKKTFLTMDAHAVWLSNWNIIWVLKSLHLKIWWLATKRIVRLAIAMNIWICSTKYILFIIHTNTTLYKAHTEKDTNTFPNWNLIKTQCCKLSNLILLCTVL